MDVNRVSSISRANSLEALGEFWDMHDFTDFDTDAPDIEFNIACSVPIESSLFSAMERQAHIRGGSVETLVNLWLQEKLSEANQAKLAA